eukprot:m.480771 g.480771  ORF g.480771 m.480771 type:complete len:321 (-) comp54096_c0_seq1:16-978(-)
MWWPSRDGNVDMLPPANLHPRSIWRWAVTTRRPVPHVRTAPRPAPNNCGSWYRRCSGSTIRHPVSSSLCGFVGHHDNSSRAVGVVDLDLVGDLVECCISVSWKRDFKPQDRCADWSDALCSATKGESALRSGGLVAEEGDIGPPLVRPNTDIAKISDRPCSGTTPCSQCVFDVVVNFFLQPRVELDHEPFWRNFGHDAKKTLQSVAAPLFHSRRNLDVDASLGVFFQNAAHHALELLFKGVVAVMVKWGSGCLTLSIQSLTTASSSSASSSQSSCEVSTRARFEARCIVAAVAAARNDTAGPPQSTPTTSAIVWICTGLS